MSLTSQSYIIRKTEGPVPIQSLIDRLGSIEVTRISSANGWSVARTFHHLAQGVEFSLKGYPNLKPFLFRASVGRLAFHLFHLRGHMSHATDEDIPGELVAEGDPERAQSRLLDALTAFERADALHPHFVYGALTKPQYAAAHAMHVADHLDDYRV